MSTISLRLPDSLHERVRELARKDGISINQFAVSAIAEKLASQMTESYLSERAARGNRANYEAALSKAPSAGPIAGDEVD